ncbi:MAG: thiamine phosphate synthase [Actinomycetota bacterium]|nr:thiamine phosphate synthase [Actinomycetota bacterium]
MRSPIDLRLYLVTDAALAAPRGLADTVRAAVKGGSGGGATVVQLRDTTASGRQLYLAAVELLEVLAPTGVALIVDDRLDVALAAGAHGTHLGQSDLPADRARAIAGPDHLLGLSAANPDEMAVLDGWPDGTVDYLGVGPVRATSTKADAGAPIGLDGLRATCHRTSLPCVAIGGMDASNARAAMSAGAAGVAVVSAICGSADPAQAAADLRACVQR